MLFTTHAVTGAAVGVATGDPYLGYFLGWVSHHVIDAIPHFDQGSFRTNKSDVKYLGISGEHVAHFSFNKRDWIMLFIDWGVSGLLFIFLFSAVPISEWGSLIIGALGALTPDIIDSSPLWSKKLREKSALLRKYHSFHIFFHWTAAKRQIWLGILTQAILVGISLAFLLKIL